MLTINSIPSTGVKAQVRGSNRDSLQAAPQKQSPAKILPLQQRAGAAKDSLWSLKDSVPSFLPSAFTQKRYKKNGGGPDSLPGLLTHDSLIKKFKALSLTELTKQSGDVKQWRNSLSEEEMSRRLASLLPVNDHKFSPGLVIGGGYFNYNYMFRSVIDTPYTEQNIGQHLLNAQLDVSAAGLPFRVSYYGRNSNSAFMRNYNDFRVAFNTPLFRKLKQDQLRRQLTGLTEKIQPRELIHNLDGMKDRIRNLKSRLSSTEVLNRYLKAKQILAYADRLPDGIGDKNTLIALSGNIVSDYEQQQQMLSGLEVTRDSLQQVYQANVKKIQQLRQMINGDLYTAGGVQQIRGELKAEGLLDKRSDRLLKTIYAVRSFAIGRTLPDMSRLSVKNLNVTGINFEYNPGNVYVALTAGKIDFRSRDFIYGKPSNIPQYVYAAAAGYGLKEGNHLILTGYSGKKQIISNSSLAAAPLSGMSIEGQWRIGRNLNVLAEAAQSTSPVHTSAQGVTKQPGFRLRDNSNKAYSIRVWGYLPATKTRMEGYYQKTGINFQNFTNYRVNANTATWSLRVEQHFWKRQLRLLASARKNDYSNPFIVQQYNSNTVFTSFSATLRRRKFPSLTLGYVPSSQYTIIGDQVAESRYQSLQVSVAHAYRIGLMSANGVFTYNRFYNSGSDTGFVYYNARHFYTWHQFVFPLFTFNIGYSGTASKQYTLDVMDGGITISYTKFFSMGGGVKINHYNTSEIRTGLYYNFRCRLQHIGDINLWYERGYLPGSTQSLVKNEWFTLGFTRYFNNTLKL